MEEVQQEQPKKFERLHGVTPLSKYLAMILFIVMPFVGGWIGYTKAPIKTVETLVLKEVPEPIQPCALEDLEYKTASSTIHDLTTVSQENIPYSVSGDQVFYEEFWLGYDEEELIPIPADPETFEYLGSEYARDKDLFFYRDRVLSGNPSDIEIKTYYGTWEDEGITVDDFIFPGNERVIVANDGVNVFVMGENLTDVDPDTYDVDERGSFIISDGFISDGIYVRWSLGHRIMIFPSSCEQFRSYLEEKQKPV